MTSPGRTSSFKPGLSLIASLALVAVGATLPSNASRDAAESYSHRRALDASQIKEMRKTESTLSAFLRYLELKEPSTNLTAKQARINAKSFIAGTNNVRVLTELALAARIKLSIYSMMPESDRRLWQALYDDCIEKMGNRSDNQNKFIISLFQHKMERTEQPTNITRQAILAKQEETSQVFQKFLTQVTSIARRLQPDHESLYHTGEQLIERIKDTDVITEVSARFFCKWHLYRSFIDPQFLNDNFTASSFKLAYQPRTQALDALDFLITIASGSAASTEHLNGCKSIVLGLTMQEYIKYQNDKSSLKTSP